MVDNNDGCAPDKHSFALSKHGCALDKHGGGGSALKSATACWLRRAQSHAVQHGFVLEDCSSDGPDRSTTSTSKLVSGLLTMREKLDAAYRNNMMNEKLVLSARKLKRCAVDEPVLTFKMLPHISIGGFCLSVCLSIGPSVCL